ncbi:MAG: hypothetical protein ACJAWL_000280 [Motiliproteus sp.]|jgi:hypothetical protein
MLSLIELLRVRWESSFLDPLLGTFLGTFLGTLLGHTVEKRLRFTQVEQVVEQLLVGKEAFKGGSDVIAG